MINLIKKALELNKIKYKDNSKFLKANLDNIEYDMCKYLISLMRSKNSKGSCFNSLLEKTEEEIISHLTHHMDFLIFLPTSNESKNICNFKINNSDFYIKEYINKNISLELLAKATKYDFYTTKIEVMRSI